jgi:secretion/DNA translocation related TadE-like protein
MSGHQAAVRRERGSATVLVLAFAGVLLLVGAALGVAAAMVRAHRVAQSGADLAALSAARALSLGGDACAEAARVALADGVRVTACRVTGSTVLVSVTAPGPHWLGQAADLSGQARAGPG